MWSSKGLASGILVSPVSRVGAEGLAYTLENIHELRLVAGMFVLFIENATYTRVKHIPKLKVAAMMQV